MGETVDASGQLKEQKMAKLSKKQVKAVENIVVSYVAWSGHLDKTIDYPNNPENLQRLRIWARMLKENQEVLGVEKVPYDKLDANIEGYLYAYIDSETGVLEYTNDRKKALGY